MWCLHNNIECPLHKDSDASMIDYPQGQTNRRWDRRELKQRSKLWRIGLDRWPKITIEKSQIWRCKSQNWQKQSNKITEYLQCTQKLDWSSWNCWIAKSRGGSSSKSLKESKGKIGYWWRWNSAYPVSKMISRYRMNNGSKWLKVWLKASSQVCLTWWKP